MNPESESVTEANAIQTHGNRVRKIYQFGAALIAIALISSGLTLVVMADGPSGFGTVIGPGALVDQAQYTVYMDSGSCYAKNGNTGDTDFSGTNATTVAQAAIDALTLARTHNELVCLRGDFTFYGLDIPSYTDIELVGSATLGTNANDYLLHLSTVHHVNINGGTWDGNKASQAVENHLIYVYDSHNVTISGCEFVEGSHSDVQLTSSRDVLIDGNYIKASNHNAVWCQDSYRIQIVNNIVESPLSDGFDIRSNSHEVLIANNIVRNTADNGIFLTEGAYNVTVDGNQLHDCSIGIFVYTGAHDCVITNNIITDSTTNSIYISPSAALTDFPYHLTIMGNQIKYAGTNAIGIRGGVADSMISHNMITDPTSNGIIFVADGATYLPTNISMIGNRIESAGVDGISISSVGLSRSTIISNSIVDSTGYGIWIYVPGATPRPNNISIIANEIEGAGNKGMMIGRGDNVRVAENQISNCELGGVAFHNSNYVQFTWNTFLNPTNGADATYPVFYDLGGLQYCSITGNVFLVTNGVRPTTIIAIPAGSNNNIVELNDFRACAASVATLTNGGTSNIIRYNLGYVTEKAGSATISASTSVVFAHGMGATPTLVLASFNLASYGNYTWSATSTEITVTVSTSGTYTVYWYAQTW